ncbi:hypothetical protein U1Q18_049698, partial [Sarracenia purpurea var. burkii]
DAVTFFCDYHPPNRATALATKYTFIFHPEGESGTRIISDEKEGITIDGRYLTMARINKTTAGNYTCETYDK